MPNRLRSSERGSSLVEAAFVLPLLALALVGTIDFGRLFYKTMAVTQAARAGAQYGSAVNPYAVTEMENKALIAGSADVAGLTAAANFTCFCYDGGVETAMTCFAGSCPTGQNRVYVTVTTHAMFTTVINYPGIPHSVSITRAARMRAQ